MLKVAVIGSGFGLYGLLPAFRSIENCKVVAVCADNKDRILKYCQNIPLDNIYSDWKKMLDDEEIDAVAIAVIPSLQYEIATYAIKKRIHIFAEKPLTASYAKAKRLLSLAQKRNIVHSVDFIFPEIYLFRKVKDLIEEKKYGKLKHIRICWDFESYDIKNNIYSWKTDVNQGGGALSFYFSHTLYYLEYFGGEISDCKSVFLYSLNNKKQIETGVDVLLRFESGVNGYAHINSNSKRFTNHQLFFQFENGTINLENKKNVTDDFVLTIYTKKGVEVIYNSGKKIKKGEDERVKYVRFIAQRFVNSCIKETEMSPNFKDGVRVEELIEKIRKDHV